MSATDRRTADKRLIVVLLFSFCLLPFDLRSQNAGRSGFAFLKVGVGGRAAGLAETQAAAANDPSAIYWNAAGLERSAGTVALFSHTSWLQGIRANFLAVVFPGLRGAVGLGMYLQTIPGIQRRTTASPEPIGVFDAHDLALTLAYSRTLHNHVQLGLSLKYVYEEIYVESASGAAVDVGVLLKDLVRGLRIGATVQNMGWAGKFRDQAIALPLLTRIGVEYAPRLRPRVAAGTLSIMSDVFMSQQGKTGVTVAGEYIYQEMLAIRIGYQFARQNRGVAGGLGVRRGRFQLDYGFMPFASDLGDTHRVSVVLRW